MKNTQCRWSYGVLVLVVIMISSACTKNSFVDRVPLGGQSCEDLFPDHIPEGAGLALSGGGYRATLFHLGALRRLNELGLLHRMDEVSSVSGGSIMSGQLATYIVRHGGRLDQPITPDDWNQHVATPLYTLTEQDIRTGPILRRYLIPWNWFSSTTAINAVADRLYEDLTDVMLKDLPMKPDFVFNATEMGFGANWEMRAWRMGSYRTGYMLPSPSDWPVARAVAASAAFPPVLQPMKVEYDKEQFKGYTWSANGQRRPSGPQSVAYPIDDQCWKTQDWKKGMEDLRLSDGGVYDNFGLEPIWKDRKFVFVSDGGMTLPAQSDEGFTSRLSRWSGIMSEQAGSLRKRMLFLLSEQTPIYWAIKQGSDEPPAYSNELAANFISYIRTDLNGFSEVERKILENHGYMVADQAVKKVAHALTLLVNLDPWPKLKIPHPEWAPPNVSECAIKRALVDSYVGCEVEEKRVVEAPSTR